MAIAVLSEKFGRYVTGTTIVVDGRPEKAHGTACLQPDGTWQVVN